MQYLDNDKMALKSGSPKIYSRISVIGTNYVFTESDTISEWTYEDFRYVPDTGFIGQFVERIFDGTLMDVPSELDLTDKRIKMELGVKANELSGINYYNYGEFIITKISYEDTTGATKFESADYGKLFNAKYNDEITYPCTAMQLAENVCSQVGVPLNANGTSYIYCVNEEDELSAGNYNFLIGDTYYNFTTNENLQKHDVIMFTSTIDADTLTIKTVRLNADNEYEITRTNTAYSTDSVAVGTTLTMAQCGYCNFTNNDYVIFGNYFDTDATNKNVIQAIAKLGYTWARVNEENKLCLDFTNKGLNYSNINDFDKLTTDEYQTSKTGSVFGPVKKVLIGLSQADGENIYVQQPDTEPTETEVIYIYDNPLTYTEELRRIAINGAETLFNLCYTPIEIASIGHPWLEGDELVQLTNVDNTVVYTYPFNRHIAYTGVLDETIKSDAQSATQMQYEYRSSEIDKVRHTLFTVNKMDGKITETIEEQDGIERRLTQTEASIGKINNIFQLQGGNNLIKNSAFLLTDKVWEFTELIENQGYHTELGKSYTTNYLGTVISNAEIKLKNIKMTSKTDLNNIVIAQINSIHTFSFKYKMDVFSTATIKLINPSDNSILWQTTLEPTGDITEVISNQIIPRYNYLVLEVSTTTTNDGFLYLYDLLLNVGDQQSWSPASDELVSTVIRLSQLGVTILARGSDFATVMSADEFAIYKATFNGEDVNLGERVSKFDGDGIDTTNITSKSVATGKYVMEDRNWGGTEHHIEYFRDEEISQNSLRSLLRQSYVAEYDANIITNSVKSVNDEETLVETTNYNKDGNTISKTTIPISKSSCDIIIDEDGE